MKIAISGGASQGKSTLVNYLINDKTFKDYSFRTNLTRSLQESGIPINELGTAVTQLYVMAKHYEFLNIKGPAIYDRCALDGLAYSMYFFKNIEPSLQIVIIKLFEAMISRYDRIFYIEPELPLIDDGQRSINKNFFDAVNKNFETVISDYKLNIIRIKGSIDDRINLIKNNL
jgi:nicotinamide riboside kinase